MKNSLLFLVDVDDDDDDDGAGSCDWLAGTQRVGTAKKRVSGEMLLRRVAERRAS